MRIAVFLYILNTHKNKDKNIQKGKMYSLTEEGYKLSGLQDYFEGKVKIRYFYLYFHVPQVFCEFSP